MGNCSKIPADTGIVRHAQAEIWTFQRRNENFSYYGVQSSFRMKGHLPECKLVHESPSPSPALSNIKHRRISSLPPFRLRNKEK